MNVNELSVGQLLINQKRVPIYRSGIKTRVMSNAVLLLTIVIGFARSYNRAQLAAYLGFGKGGPWRARGARAYNGGLRAEPPAGSRGRATGREVRGAKPPEAETLFASECSMETANSPIFLKFRNAKNHKTLLNFAILAGKWQKTHLFI